MIKTLKEILLQLNNANKNTAKFSKLSFSQCGEDIIIDYIFQLRGINLPTYIDIGAHHPFYLNNTALFYKKGARGVNVEANPNLIEKFLKFRRDDINLNVGIAPNYGESDFFIFKDDTLSTFSKEEADILLSFKRQGNDDKYSIIKVEKVTTCPLLYILEKHCKNTMPDFLSIDVEGLDLEILKTINYLTNPPKVICVEAAEHSPIGIGKRKTQIIDFLTSQGYYEYANTNLNAILVQKDFWFNY